MFVCPDALVLFVLIEGVYFACGELPRYEMKENKVTIYTADDGITKIDVKLEEETLWLTLDRAYELYQTDKSNVSGRIGSNGKNAWRRT